MLSYPSIQPDSSAYLEFWWSRQPSPAVMGKETGYNPDRLQIYYRANTERHGQLFTLTVTFTPTTNLESSINLTCLCLDCGRKPEVPEEKSPRHEENIQS